MVNGTTKFEVKNGAVTATEFIGDGSKLTGLLKLQKLNHLDIISTDSTTTIKMTKDLDTGFGSDTAIQIFDNLQDANSSRFKIGLRRRC